MEELNQFLNSVEASARKILKQQNKKQQELVVRERAALARARKTGNGASPSRSSSPSKAAAPSVSRDELRASYSSGGALIVAAPSPQRRDSGASGEQPASPLHHLPRLSSPPECGAAPPSLSPSRGESPSLPSLEAAVTASATRKAQREKQASDKIVRSPLFRSLAAASGSGDQQRTQTIKRSLHEVDRVNHLLKKLGLRAQATSASQRPDHSVEKRLCHACWSQPTKLTGCEHHPRVVGANQLRHGNGTNNNNAADSLQAEAQLLQQLELQGPSSWSPDDLYVKYRSELDRERAWAAFQRLKQAEAEQEELQQQLLQGQQDGATATTSPMPVIPIVARHPIVAAFVTQLQLEVLRSQAETRRRNQARTFVFDVNHVWLTNLDHFNQAERGNGAIALGTEKEEEEQEKEMEAEGGAELALSDRRDESAIRDGYSQIQSISTSRALRHAIFPDAHSHRASASLHLSQKSTSLQTQGSTLPMHVQTPVLRRRKRPLTGEQTHEPFVAPLSLLVCMQWRVPRPTGSYAIEETKEEVGEEKQQEKKEEMEEEGDEKEVENSTLNKTEAALAANDLLSRVPGASFVGESPTLWWRSQQDDLSPVDGDNDGHHHADCQSTSSFEYTQVVALFTRSSELSSSNAILVTLVLALDAPVLAPPWLAWHIGSKSPPPALTTAITTNWAIPPPRLVSSCVTTLLATPLTSVLDHLRPPTIVVFNPLATALDCEQDLEEPFGHRRQWPRRESSAHAFRLWWRTSRPSVTYEGIDAVPALQLHVVARGCRLQLALPNAAGLGGRYCWHAIDPEGRELCRRRLAKDFIDILQNSTPREPNDPVFVTVALRHEALRDVCVGPLAAYVAMLAERRAQHEYAETLLAIERKIEMGRLALAARREEQDRIALADSARRRDRSNRQVIEAADHETREAALLEWEQRLAQSELRDERGGWQRREVMKDASRVVFYFSLNDALPRRQRFAWRRPATWPVVGADGGEEEEGEEQEGGEDKEEEEYEEEDGEDGSSQGDDSEEEDGEANQENEAERQRREEMASMTAKLLEDEQFLRELRSKLGLAPMAAGGHHEHNKLTNDKDHIDSGECAANRIDLRDQMILVTEEPNRSRASLMASKMARLQLEGVAKKSALAVAPGQGWKRLQTSRLPTNFVRMVYATHTAPPRADAALNQPNHACPVGMMDPRDASASASAEDGRPEFIPELRALVVPNVRADLQERKHQWAAYQEEQGQHQESSIGRRGAVAGNDANSNRDALFERDLEASQASMANKVARAVLCARNNNLEGMEAALDDGVDVNARDEHGNTLFILVCQQGNKKLAKLLLRRHADMNLQNRHGNTALHYLVEYKHEALAAYVKGKGANDTITNAAGLTCYEGLTQDHVESL